MKSGRVPWGPARFSIAFLVYFGIVPPETNSICCALKASFGVAVTSRIYQGAQSLNRSETVPKIK